MAPCLSGVSQSPAPSFTPWHWGQVSVAINHFSSFGGSGMVLLRGEWNIPYIPMSLSKVQKRDSQVFKGKWKWMYILAEMEILLPWLLCKMYLYLTHKAYHAIWEKENSSLLPPLHHPLHPSRRLTLKFLLKRLKVGLHFLFPSSSDVTQTSQSESVSRSSCVWFFATPCTAACQAPLSMGFSRQEYWSELLCPSPGDLPDPMIKPVSLISPALQVDPLASESPGKP